MKKLSKEQLDERDQLLSDLEAAEKAIMEELERVSGAIGDYNQLLDAYSDKLEAVNAFAQNISEEVETYVSDKSEKWQESDVGTQVSDWGQEWANIEYERLELIDEPSLPNMDYSEFENMRTDSEE